MILFVEPGPLIEIAVLALDELRQLDRQQQLEADARVLKNLLSSIGQSSARICSTEPLIKCGSSTRSTSTTMPWKPSVWRMP